MITVTYDKRHRFFQSNAEIKLIGDKLKLTQYINVDVAEAISHPLSVSATGKELLYILKRISNLPILVDPDIPWEEKSMVWHGDFAKFIIYNLAIDWQWWTEVMDAELDAELGPRGVGHDN